MSNTQVKVWLFDLDDTLHHASKHIFPRQYEAMHRFIEQRFALTPEQAVALRRELFLRHGTTGFGLYREHGIGLHEFFEAVQDDAELERLVEWHSADWNALHRLPGRKVLLTNAQRSYAARVLRRIGLAHLFERIVCFDDMHFAGRPRPKPDTRMLRMLCARMHVRPARCMLIEDTIGHLKAARRIGLRTALMRRYSPWARRCRGRPAYVCAKIAAVRELMRWT
jgi:putative hydrolase of the HAD superfamily